MSDEVVVLFFQVMRALPLLQMGMVYALYYNLDCNAQEMDAAELALCMEKQYFLLAV